MRWARAGFIKCNGANKSGPDGFCQSRGFMGRVHVVCSMTYQHLGC